MNKYLKNRKFILFVLLLSCLSVITLFFVTGNKNKESKIDYKVTSVTEGNLESSSLLSGNVVPAEQQYVKFEPSRGLEAWPVVKVGDKIEVGQQLLQYNIDGISIDYDIAIRKLQQIGREINHLKTYGPFEPFENYNKELQELNDDYANAQSEIDRVQIKLNQAVVKSKISGTVAEIGVGNNLNEEDGFIVWVVNEDKLQIEGILTQYDLMNLQVNQEVKIKSKASPNTEFLGRISYIAPFPKHNLSSNSNEKTSYYDFRVEFLEEVPQLKSGFQVSLEIVRSNSAMIVPISSVVRDNGVEFVWLYDAKTKKVSKKNIKTGIADSENQEILDGLNTTQMVIINPDDYLKEGALITDIDSEK